MEPATAATYLHSERSILKNKERFYFIISVLKKKGSCDVCESHEHYEYTYTKIT